ncbi:MAG: DUF4381 domain-containing protein [Gammaproteobacteria bacterium]|jgi:hypothetical protein|nr:DUF4381 domain-containing protein [Gammaproteobacteria bacterium]
MNTMNEPVLNHQAPGSKIIDPQMIHPQVTNPQQLNLRDIHLPEPVSWWPPAPGWWIILALAVLIAALVTIARRIYLGRQLRRDIKSELDNIKQQFQQNRNKTRLAKSLSILLRRASISYYPRADIAGLTGDDWLSYLDDSNAKSSSGNRFQSDTGRVLLTAPYLPDTDQQDNDRLDFDAQKLIQLCESWLQSPHNRPLRGRS